MKYHQKTTRGSLNPTLENSLSSHGFLRQLEVGHVSHWSIGLLFSFKDLFVFEKESASEEGAGGSDWTEDPKWALC